MKNLKKVLCVLLVVLMCLTSAPLSGFVGLELPEWNWKVSADYGGKPSNYNGFLYNRSSENIRIVGYEGDSSIIEIPREIDGYIVTEVSSSYGSTISESVKKMIVPNTVTKFDVTSDSIEELVLPDSITTIVGIQCKNLKELKIPDKVTSLGIIASDKIKVLEIPKNVETIGNITCKSLKKLNIPEKVTKIYDFRGCNNLTEICFEGAIESVPHGAFYECISLKKVEFKKGVKAIEDMAFYFCLSLEEINLSEGIERIEERAFSFCQSMKKIEIPQSVKNIEESAFEMCVSLRSVTIADNVKCIEKNAFAECVSMEEASIYNKTVKIGEQAFYNNFIISNLEEYLALNYKSIKEGFDIQEKFNEYVAANRGSINEKEMQEYYDKLLEESNILKWSKKANALMKSSSNKLLIRCYKGSTAEKYAKENGVKYKYFSNNPDEVTGFKASGVSTSAIALKWTSVSNATGYVIYQYNSTQKKYVKLISTKDTSYKVSKLKSGTIYKFKIKAYKKVNGKYYYSDYTTLSIATKPGTPKLKVSAGINKATLTWNKQSGATGYVVYMSTSKNGVYSKVATIKGGSKSNYTKKNLKKGKAYYFKVRAYVTVNKTNIYGAYSNIKGIKSK